MPKPQTPGAEKPRQKTYEELLKENKINAEEFVKYYGDKGIGPLFLQKVRGDIELQQVTPDEISKLLSNFEQMMILDKKIEKEQNALDKLNLLHDHVKEFLKTSNLENARFAFRTARSAWELCREKASEKNIDQKRLREFKEYFFLTMDNIFVTFGKEEEFRQGIKDVMEKTIKQKESI